MSSSTRRPPTHPGKPGKDPTRHLEKFVVEEVELGGKPEIRTGPPRRLMPRFRFPFGTAMGWLGLWLALTLATLAGREVWPFDETRELAIAWEMWSSGHWWVPTLNGEPIGRAPLFTWLILAAWKFAGVDELLAVRLIAPVFALGSLALLVRIARKLWPDSPDVASHAPYFALGSVFLALIMPALRAETLGLFFMLLSVWGLLIMWRSRDARAWLLFGPALGFAQLAQGGLALLSVLPVALLAPLWARGPVRPVWRHWYLDVFKGLALAAVLVLVWLVPAAGQAGPLFIVRTVTDGLALQALEFFPAQWPWWGYLWQLPVAFLPWSILPLMWLRLLHVGRAEFNSGLAFCLVWLASTTVLLSLFAVKQPSFLLAPLAALVLLVAWLAFEPKLDGRGDHHPLAGLTLPMILAGGLLVVIPKLPRTEYLPAILWEVSPLAGVAVMIIGIALAWMPVHDVRRRILNAAVIVAMGVTITILVAGLQLSPLQGVEAVARAIAERQAAGQPVAHVGPYRGEYHYAGRLRHPLARLEARDADQWFTQHANGVVVSSSEVWQPADAGTRRPLLDQRFRDHAIRVWSPAQ
jgi:4-amino-4-deoxy-L-arabinose transferase-like glycosyltransferase